MSVHSNRICLVSQTKLHSRSCFYLSQMNLSIQSRTSRVDWPNTVVEILWRSKTSSCISVRFPYSQCIYTYLIARATERNHNIRIPGFAADDTKISLSQSALAPSYVAPGGKKTAQGPHMTLRSQRLAQVQQAKREAKLM